MGINRIVTTGGVAALAGMLLLSGCTGSEPPGDSAASTAEANAGPSGSAGSPATDGSVLSAFEQQLPLKGDFVSQWTETTGSVVIERRTDGSAWATLTGFSTGAATDLRLQLKEGALEQDGTGAWVDTAGYSFEIGPVDPARPDQEIAVPGAHLMPAISTLTVMSYESPDYPSFGSVALAK